jgi:hypothetical protein
MGTHFQFNSKDTAIVAIASATLGLVESMIFTTVYPLLPPIVVVPFLTCFFFGVTLAFSRKQLAIGIIAFLVTALVRGTMMPGQLMVPVYGLLFQGAKTENRHSCRIVGFAGSALHVLYGVVLAPLVFSVARATAVVSWIRPLAGTFELSLAICAVAFGLFGMLRADAGCRTGLLLRAKVGPGGSML